MQTLWFQFIFFGLICCYLLCYYPCFINSRKALVILISLSIVVVKWYLHYGHRIELHYHVGILDMLPCVLVFFCDVIFSDPSWDSINLVDFGSVRWRGLVSGPIVSPLKRT